MRHVEIDGLRIAYECVGDGPPLVLLHGFLGDSRMMRPQIEGLSSSFQIVAWDAPGCGKSSDPPEDFSMAGYATCLAGLMSEIGLDAAHILGVSWGGVLAQEFYRRHPERVTSLVLADTYAGWEGSLGERVCAERLASCLRESELPASEFVPGFMTGLFSEAAPKTVRDEVAAIVSEFHPVGYRVMSRGLATDTRGSLPRIDAPTLLLWGEADRRSPVHVAEEMRILIPNARLLVIPGAGHLSNIEQPELFNAEVRAFCGSVLSSPRSSWR